MNRTPGHLHSAMIGLLLTFLFGIPVRGTEGAATAGTRLQLRNETAIHYMKPEPHLRLARYHYDLGDKVQAFYMAEYARKMFGDDEFTPVFEKVAAIKLRESPAFKDEAKLNKYCREHPDSVEAQLQALDQELRQPVPGKEDVAQSLERILAKFPRYLAPKAVAAKYFLKAKRDEDRALDLYIDLYFYDPHYYDWEYAEFRVKQITSGKKKAWWAARQQIGLPLMQLVAGERNPRVLDVAIDQAREKWDASLVPAMLALLDNDDPTVQTHALHTLLDHSADITDLNVIRAMLKGDDLVKRAMAALLVVKCLGPAEFPLLGENLASGIELVQIDTMEALGMTGGPKGLEYLKAHPPAKATKEIMDFWRHQISSKGTEPGGKSLDP